MNPLNLGSSGRCCPGSCSLSAARLCVGRKRLSANCLLMPCISKDCEPKARKPVRAQDPGISGKPPVTENSLEISHFGGPLRLKLPYDFAVEHKIGSEFADD